MPPDRYRGHLMMTRFLPDFVGVPYLALIAFRSESCRSCHPNGGWLLHREFGKKQSPQHTPHPASGAFSYPATTPPDSHAGRITAFRGGGTAWATSAGSSAASTNGSRWPNGLSRRPARIARWSAR